MVVMSGEVVDLLEPYYSDDFCLKAILGFLGKRRFLNRITFIPTIRLSLLNIFI